MRISVGIGRYSINLHISPGLFLVDPFALRPNVIHWKDGGSTRGVYLRLAIVALDLSAHDLGKLLPAPLSHDPIFDIIGHLERCASIDDGSGLNTHVADILALCNAYRSLSKKAARKHAALMQATGARPRKKGQREAARR